MFDIKARLDQYLTSEPDDDYTPWFEQLCEHLSEPLCRWDDERSNDPTCSDEFDALTGALYQAGIDPIPAAQIVNKAFSVFEKFKWI